MAALEWMAALAWMAPGAATKGVMGAGCGDYMGEERVDTLEYGGWREMGNKKERMEGENEDMEKNGWRTEEG